MGPLIVLLFWAIIAGVLSIIFGALLAALVSLLTRGVREGRKLAVRTSALLPAAGFSYLFACILVFSIWSQARGRDWGWGDTWDTPLIGTYHLMMIDVRDKGTIYNRADPKVYSDGSVVGVSGHKDVIFGVRRIEVRPPFLFGTASPEAFMEYPLKSPETLFFELDTRTGSRIDYVSLEALEAAARQSGGSLKLKSVDAVYSQFRYDRLDLIPAVVLAIPPLFALLFLVRALIKLRRSRESSLPELNSSPLV